MSVLSNVTKQLRAQASKVSSLLCHHTISDTLVSETEEKIPLEMGFSILTPGPLLILSFKAEVSDRRPMGYTQPRMAVNAAQHKIINLLKHCEFFFAISCHNLFNGWPKTTLLFPVWPRDTKRSDAPAREGCL